MISALNVKTGHTLLLIVITFFASLMPAFALASGAPMISLNVSPSAQNVTSGGSAKFIIDVTALGALGSPIRAMNLSVSGVPAGVNATFYPNPVPIKNAYGFTTLTLSVATYVVPGSISIKIISEGIDEKGHRASTYDIVSVNVKSQERQTVTISSVVTSISTATSTRFTAFTTTVVAPTQTITAITSTIATITVTNTTSITVKEVRESDTWSYSPIGAGIALAGLFIAITIFRRK